MYNSKKEVKIITTEDLTSLISQTYPVALKGKAVYGIPR